MCTQCIVNPLYFGEVLPGWYLIRARREAPNEMDVGDWGLLRCNDPDVVFKTTPMKDPDPSDEDGTKDPESSTISDPNLLKEFYNRVDKFSDEFYCSPYIGYLLVEAGIRVGYNHENDGSFIDWLFSYLGEYIDKTEPTVEEDCFPHLDAVSKHDYSLDKR